ncbi:tRNA lysidine(34) synthetase TilS [Vibrio sp. V39_P1S14PM300]|uniref:tRNA lysidine(34) synthetase TilS n=1 Tax=Vibrio sp. V39_P1S14PM300 TaxID=1938690 RepID=UPI0013731FFF|nr:tRNA lysidine(34) synthetase TilS [Vibrio sp. V39_P1S14PM300]NAX22276.1 tRNA lysidine(34) synthetase TilS [Vibrio sp. V39_P1S14PM300]
MLDIYPRFCAAVTPYCQPSSRLVVGLSGGVDSRVLLALAARYGREHQVPCVAVHVHHGLSLNADDWACQCAHWCEESGIALVVERITLARQGGESLEQIARDGRYQALHRHIRPGDLLLTGQHADDQVETFLLALKRGSGPKGLACMAPVSSFGEGMLIRPLLEVTREQIEALALSESLEWVEDESNQDTRFERNFIRHQLTPQLTERWPVFRRSVQRSARLCAEQEALLDELLADKYQMISAKDDSLSISALDECSTVMRNRLLRMWFAVHQQRMPGNAHLALIWSEVACAQQDANPRLKIDQVEVRRFAGHLYLVAHCADVSGWQHPILPDQPLSLPQGLGQLRIIHTEGQGHLNLSHCDPSQFWVTFDPTGLSAHPAERSHSRKLKKLFQEYGVPSWLRRRTPILMYQEQVVCVAGVFVDRAFNGQDCELIWDK